jgi:hypothetical protein
MIFSEVLLAAEVAEKKSFNLRARWLLTQKVKLFASPAPCETPFQ